MDPRPRQDPRGQALRGDDERKRHPRNAAESLFDDDTPAAPRRKREERAAPEFGTETFRIEVGHQHGVQPGNIVGAIANEAELDSRYIGRIDIRDDHTLVDLPEGMPREVLEILKKARVAGRPMRISRVETDGAARPARRPAGPHRGKPAHGAPRKPRPPR